MCTYGGTAVRTISDYVIHNFYYLMVDMHSPSCCTANPILSRDALECRCSMLASYIAICDDALQHSAVSVDLSCLHEFVKTIDTTCESHTVLLFVHSTASVRYSYCLHVKLSAGCPAIATSMKCPGLRAIFVCERTYHVRCSGVLQLIKTHHYVAQPIAISGGSRI